MNQKAQAGYASLHFFYWAMNAAVYSFSSAFLLPAGFSSTEIGLIMCLGNGIALIAEPFLADYCDKSDRFSLTQIISAISILFMAFCGMLFFLTERSTALFVFYVLTLVGHTVMHPVINELNYRFERAGCQMNYGFARAMGSLGYSLLSALLGTLVEKYGTFMIPAAGEAVAALILLILAVLAKLYRETGYHRVIEHKDEGEEGSLVQFVKKYPQLLLINLGGLFLFYSAHSCGTYMLQIIMNVGGDASTLGMALAISAGSEVPAMIAYRCFEKKFGVKAMMRLSALGFLIKTALFMIAKSYSMILFAALFQMVSFAVYIPASTAASNLLTAESDAAKGQSLMPAMSSLAGLMANLSGGLLIDRFGVGSLLLICTIMSLIGTLIMFKATSRMEA